jgi:hypothetical protein
VVYLNGKSVSESVLSPRSPLKLVLQYEPNQFSLELDFFKACVLLGNNYVLYQRSKKKNVLDTLCLSGLIKLSEFTRKPRCVAIIFTDEAMYVTFW